jgi:hypothetical protein
MTSDAYKPPNAELVEPRLGAAKLYSPRQVAGAAFLGSPLAGCWLLAQNYAVLGIERARKPLLVWGVLGSLAILGVSLALPERFLSVVLPVGYTIAFLQIARALQGPEFEEHVRAGGQKHVWRVVGIGILCAVLFIGAAVPVVLLMGLAK